MEYLEMHGTVKLKPDADITLTIDVLNKLQETEFVDAGYIDISFKNGMICIEADGMIVESYSLTLLLRKLQDQLAENSTISISRVRWEIYVRLKHYETATELMLEPREPMVLAQ